MYTRETALGDYSLELNIDDALADHFSIFEIDALRLAHVAKKMGAVETIERRLDTNPASRDGLVINYQRKPLSAPSSKTTTLGVAYFPRKKEGKMPPADITVPALSHVSKVVLDRRTEGNTTIDQMQDPEFVNGIVMASIESTTRHEIGHFTDPRFDVAYSALGSRKKARRSRQFARQDRQTAAVHPEVIAAEQQLSAMLPASRLGAKATRWYMVEKEGVLKIASDMLGRAGMPFLPYTPSQITTLSENLDFLKTYYYLPPEQKARADEATFRHLGGFSNVELKPEALARLHKPTTATSLDIYYILAGDRIA